MQQFQVLSLYYLYTAGPVASVQQLASAGSLASTGPLAWAVAFPASMAAGLALPRNENHCLDRWKAEGEEELGKGGGGGLSEAEELARLQQTLVKSRQSL